MPFRTQRRTTDRKAILRGIYEDNLRTVGRATGRPQGPSLRAGRNTGIAIGLLGVLGVVLFQAVRASDLPSAGPAASAQGIVQSAFAPADPAMRAAGSAALASGAGTNLSIATIVIDAGHGGMDPGAIGPEGLMEKDVTLDVAHRLRRLLEERGGYRILMTREEDRRLSLKERVAFANQQGADLFISIHINWLPDASQTGVETYHYGPGSDSRTRLLAERENRNSGYTIAEFNELTQRLGLVLKVQESRDLALSIQSSLSQDLVRVGRRSGDQGVRSGDFTVLLGVESPSVLAEIATLSHPAEEAKLNTPEHRELLASRLEAGIVNYLDKHFTRTGPTEHAGQTQED
jgi:N-acetylmuramoyl-L-alanine amidase